MSPWLLLLFAAVASANPSNVCAGGGCDADIPQSAASLLAKTTRRQQIITDQTTHNKQTMQTERTEKFWYTTDEPDPDVLQWDTRGTAGQRVARWGWLKVPISHEAEGNVYQFKHACLRVRSISAAETGLPKKVMFVHCGGPGSGRSCDMGITDRLLKEYDVITMNQRGHSILHGMSGDQNDAEPPVCPFKDDRGNNIEAFPVINCNELSQEQNLKNVPEWTGEKETSEIYKNVIDPAINGRAFNSLLDSGNETAMRWAIRLAKLEYNLCYKRYQYFVNMTTGQISSAFDFTGTSNLVHDMNVFRKAIGADELACWGGSYGTQVCSNFATIYPSLTGKLILDGNVEPRPDVVSLADEGAEGPMAVFRGIAAACEASLVSENKDDVCPMAPFMAEKVQATINGQNAIKKALLNEAWNSYSGQKDVPCAAVMMSCMSFIINGGPKPAGCNNRLGALIEKYLPASLVSSDQPSILQLNDIFDKKDQIQPKPVYAVLADVKAVRYQKHAQQPKYMESNPEDHFGMAAIMAVSAMDIHGRMTEEGIIKWWKDAGSRFTMGLGRALFFAMGVSIWPAVATPVPPAGDPDLKPLIIGNLRDLQTSYLATQRMKQGFPKGRLLTYQGYGHCLGPGYGDNMAAEASCLKHVEDYLYEGKLPEDGSTCAVITTAKVGKADAERQVDMC